MAKKEKEEQLAMVSDEGSMIMKFLFALALAAGVKPKDLAKYAAGDGTLEFASDFTKEYGTAVLKGVGEGLNEMLDMLKKSKGKSKK